MSTDVSDGGTNQQGRSRPSLHDTLPTAAQCPNCGGPLSETSVLALAPVCERCGTVITKVGGTLGLTSAYGVNDPSITRKRVEADLAVFCEYRNNYVGMLEACKEQLNWGVERYAKFPHPPELLAVQPVPPLYKGLLMGLAWCVLFFSVDFRLQRYPNAASGGSILFSPIALCLCLKGYFKARLANGHRPVENARRQRAYEEARAAALKAAEPVKAAQDHRLSVQIRELEGLVTTVTEKGENVSRLLRTL